MKKNALRISALRINFFRQGRTKLLKSAYITVPYCTNCRVVMDVRVCRYCDIKTVKYPQTCIISYVVMENLMLAARIKMQSILQ